MNPPHLKSKRRKTEILLKHPSLKKYIPTTSPFSRSHLYSMIAQYETVFVKPDKGRFGRGVMKVQRLAGGYKLHYLQRSRVYRTFDGLLYAIKTIAGRKKVIIQQGIDMLTYRNRPFDLRVMVQRSPANRWETTGILARVAAPGKIVTNFHAGGKAQPLRQLLAGYMSKKGQTKMIRRLSFLGRKAALHYHQHLAELHEIGIDVALDYKLRPWILEVNTRPDAFVFKELKNKSMFRKIMRYARSYGKYRDKLPGVGVLKYRRERL